MTESTTTTQESAEAIALTTESAKTAALYAALAKAQGQFMPIEKNREVRIQMKTGGAYNFRYADLQEVLAKTRFGLTTNGLALVQTIEPAGTGMQLVCRLAHAQGGSMTSSVPLASARDMGDPKAFGAAISYLRRYLVTAILGVAADDDLDENGQEAGGYEQPAATGKAAVVQPQRRNSEAAAQRATTQRRVEEAGDPNALMLATAGEFNYIQKKLDAQGITWEEAHQRAGLEFVPDTQLTKATFNALKAVL